jgi:hypothetical protein
VTNHRVVSKARFLKEYRVLDFKVWRE